jgi:hypothetical protein
VEVVSLWEVQAESQRRLGLSRESLTDVELRAASNDLLLLLNEEVGELQRHGGEYKRHVLDVRPRDPSNVLHGVVDVVKTAWAIAQLHGVTREDFEAAFMTKTYQVEERAAGQQALVAATHVLCVDMDEVISEMDDWYDHMALADHIPDDVERGLAREKLKHDWYISGRFRNAQPVPGVVDSLETVRSWGWRIVIVTARPNWEYKRISADTSWWLDQWKVPRDLVLYGKDKVELIHQFIAPAWPVAFVEDMERNVRALSAARVNTLLFERHHNARIEPLPGVTRVKNWNETLKQLESLRASAPCR